MKPFSNDFSRSTYKKHNPEFHCTVARYGVTHVARPTATKHKHKNPNTYLGIVPKRTQGYPTLLCEEIGHKVMDMVKRMRELRAVINYSILIAMATRITMANDRTVLQENVEATEFTLLTPTPQNRQTHSNNSSAVADELFECV